MMLKMHVGIWRRNDGLLAVGRLIVVVVIVVVDAVSDVERGVGLEVVESVGVV